MEQVSPEPVLLEADNLGVRYRGNQEDILSGINLRLGKGFGFLLGRNASGKSTLMRVLATISTRFTGELRLIGEDPKDPDQKREIRKMLGFLPQDFAFTPRFTVREFVEYCGWLKGQRSAVAQQGAVRALDRVGLIQSAELRLGSLSGGTLRRVGLAQSLVNDPRVLILDEPSSGLDTEQRARLDELLASLARERAVLVSSHLIQEAARHADTIHLLVGGRLEFSGTIHEFFALSDESLGPQTAAERSYAHLHRMAEE